MAKTPKPKAKAKATPRRKKTTTTASETTETGRKELWEITKPNLGGRPRKFKDAQALLDACMSYFQWIKDNSLQEEKVFNFQGRITRTHVSKMRAMTLGGLQLHAHVSHGQWSKWRDPEHTDHRSDLLPVMNWAEETIREQKFTGAAADLLNANIISRDIGLVDKSEVKQGVTVQMSKEDGDL